MVTSNKLPEKKIAKMAEQNNSVVVVPQRTLLGEVNEHITCPLCRGYYIDATTIVECLHSFCRSCIIKHLQVKSYCPVCEMMINSAKPNIKLDKALQDIVYKLVPGLFQKEMERRQLFYSSRPGPAASATPEQRGEDTERIIFSPEDVISFSLEYCDVTDTDSVSSKSSDSNEAQSVVATARRYLQCPAVVNISHLKKFLSMKFDIDSTQFAIDILYKRVPLPDYYTLMDIAYIYNWKRNEPMRFFYQIIDYVAIRSRIFDINRKGTHFRDRKSSPSTDDTNVNSPAPNLNDQCSEASSGIDSPMPGENSSKQLTDTGRKNEKSEFKNNNKLETTKPGSPKNEDVEKSQFLNSFELTAKNNSVSSKSSPDKSGSATGTSEGNHLKSQTSSSPKGDETLKRKLQQHPHINEMKKLKIEIEKTKLPCNTTFGTPISSTFTAKAPEIPSKSMEHESTSKNPVPQAISKPSNTSSVCSKSSTADQSTSVKPNSDIPGAKRPVSDPQNLSPLKRKTPDIPLPLSVPPKNISPLKLQVPKLDSKSHKQSDVQKPVTKKIPDLKPSSALSQSAQNKGQTINKIRMDLLANNSDPTIDRSKIMSQVKSSLIPNTGQSSSGDPLKSLFDSCKINIPSSLSITLTDQKQDARNPNESTNLEPKAVNKNLASASNAPTHKVPSPPVHNYIEILKLPEGDQKKPIKPDTPSTPDIKTTTPNKVDPTTTQQKPKSSETPSAKGPIPNLKPISDTKLAKQSVNFVGPKTFQQTFEQQLQSFQTDKKPKLPKNKSQVPKLVPATPKAFSAANLNNPGNKPTQSSVSSNIETKSGAALDLSTPHNLQSQLNPQQTKAFETMQSIANLAKKQSLPSKSASQTSQSFSNLSNRAVNPSGAGGPLRIPSSNAPQTNKKEIAGALPPNTLRQDSTTNKTNHNKSMAPSSSPLSSSTYQMPTHHSPNTTQPSPRPQTRSPSSSPKLVIAEEKQISNPNEQNANQSNQVTSTQLPTLNMPKSESSKASPGPSKPGLKPMKPITPAGKMPGIRQSMAPVVKPNPTPADIQLMAHQAILRHQIEMNAWLKAQRFDVYKNMSKIGHQQQNDYNKDK